MINRFINGFFVLARVQINSILHASVMIEDGNWFDVMLWDIAICNSWIRDNRHR